MCSPCTWSGEEVVFNMYTTADEGYEECRWMRGLVADPVKFGAPAAISKDRTQLKFLCDKYTRFSDVGLRDISLMQLKLVFRV